MPKTKILFFSHSPYLYGAECCLLSLVKSLDNTRFESVVILPAAGALKDQLEALEVRCHVVPLEWWVKNEGRFLYPQNELLQRVDQLLRIVADERPDIIHSNTSVIWFGAFAARVLGVRHVWHLHEALSDHPGLEPAFPIPLLYQAVDFLSEKVVVVSNTLRSEIEGYTAKGKLRTILNAVPDQSPGASAGSLRAELNAGKDRIIAVTVTTLQKVKGIDILLSAAAQVAKDRPDVLFIIAGTGLREAVESLTREIARLGLEESVLYLGYRKDVPDLLATADFLILPSRKESFSLAVLEAMSQSKPIITTDCGGPTELVVDGVTGMVVPVEDAATLADRIVELASDREKMSSMGSSGQRRFLEHFTLERYAREFQELYTEVLSAPKQPASAKEHSLLTAILEAYQGYMRAVRTVQEKESAIAALTDQCTALSALLSDRERCLAKLQEKLEYSLDERSAEFVNRDAEISRLKEELVQTRGRSSDMQARLDSKRCKLADLDQELEQLDAEIVSTLELHAELGEHPERAAQIVSGNERLRLIRERLASSNELRTELEMKVLQHRTELAARDLRIAELEAALASAGQARAELEDGLRQKGVELADRDLNIRQLQEALARSEQAQSEAESAQRQLAVELADREARIGQIEEEVLRESRRVEEEIRTKGEAVQKQLAALQTAKLDLENRLREKTVELGQREQQARQIAEEVMQQSRTVEEKLGHQDQSILHLSGQLSATAEKLNRTEEELARLRADREREADSCRQSIREKEQRIEDLLNSLSWRITGPLRKTYDIIKGRK